MTVVVGEFGFVIVAPAVGPLTNDQTPVDGETLFAAIVNEVSPQIDWSGPAKGVKGAPIDTLICTLLELLSQTPFDIVY